VIPVILLGEDSPPTAHPAELLLVVHQAASDVVPWIYLGDGTSHRLELSLESADRVRAALAAALLPSRVGPRAQ
jgi:hypothetical protein